MLKNICFFSQKKMDLNLDFCGFDLVRFYESICRDPNKKPCMPVDVDEFFEAFTTTNLSLAKNIIILVKMLQMDFNELKLKQNKKRKHSNNDEQQQLNSKNTNLKKQNNSNEVIRSSKIDLFITKSKLYQAIRHSIAPSMQIAIVWMYFPLDYNHRGYIISKILNKEYININVEQLLTIEDNYIKSDVVKFHFENDKQIVGIFMRIADILKDKSATRLAHAINETIYFTLCSQFSTNFKTITPFSVLLDQYINLCVAKTEQKQKRQLFVNRFFENQEKTIDFLINNLPQLYEECISNDEKQIIEFYPNCSSKSYSQRIITSATKCGYIIQMKDSCIYDVLAHKNESFAHLPWSERLKQYNTNETKIQLEKINLKTFKPITFPERRQITISWLKNDLFMSRIITTNCLNGTNLKNFIQIKEKSV